VGTKKLAPSLVKALAQYPSVAALAKEVGVARTVFWEWVKVRGSIPGDYAILVERACGGSPTALEVVQDAHEHLVRRMRERGRDMAA
jgi:DNA-binding transcriptional regulator YdaS (Cro superfamily)